MASETPPTPFDNYAATPDTNVDSKTLEHVIEIVRTTAAREQKERELTGHAAENALAVAAALASHDYQPEIVWGYIVQPNAYDDRENPPSSPMDAGMRGVSHVWTEINPPGHSVITCDLATEIPNTDPEVAVYSPRPYAYSPLELFPLRPEMEPKHFQTMNYAATHSRFAYRTPDEEQNDAQRDAERYN